MTIYTVYQTSPTSADWEPFDGCDATPDTTTITVYVSYAHDAISDTVEEYTGDELKELDEIDHPESFELLPDVHKPKPIFRKVEPMARPPPVSCGRVWPRSEVVFRV